MKRDLYRVLTTQFLTAFADNAVLFAVITMVVKEAGLSAWYVPALQASFLVAYVLLAPWVGRYADRRPKPRVLFSANLIKAVGVGMLLLGIEPIAAYAVVGLGAAIYSPAKYGILPELVDEQALVKANGWIEGSTIIAILGGTVAGAMLANYSIMLAFGAVVGLYLLSAAVAYTITHSFIAKVEDDAEHKVAVIPQFAQQMRDLLATPRARFSTLGVSLFWASATVLRVLLVAWAPAVLLMTSTTDIAQLTMFVALGIAVGAVLVPRLIPIAYLRRARMAAYLMALLIVLMSLVGSVEWARVMLFLIGVSGGLFVVPINAALQEIGYKTIGSGGAVAIQNFFEHLAMLVASGIYAVVAGAGVSPVVTMVWLGVIVMIATVLVSWHLPKDSGALEDEG